MTSAESPSVDPRLIAVGPALAAGALVLRAIGVPAAAALPAVALTVLVPGYLLTLALVRRHSLTSEERAMFVIGLGFAATILLGLAIHLSPFALTAWSWALALAAVWVAGILALRPAATELALPTLAYVPAANLAMAGGGALLFLAAFVVAREGFHAQPRPGFTELWLLPSVERGVPVVEIGVRAAEGQTMSYEVQVTGAEGQVMRMSLPPLDHGEIWTRTLPLASLPTGDLIVDLLIEGGVYRRVTLSGDENEVDNVVTPGEAPGLE